MSQPRFSVIMAARNCESYIDEAIESVLAQTLGEFELIVSDDGSTDKTAERVREQSRRDSRVRLLRHTPNGRAGSNRNFAIGHARGDWIAFLDADDIWSPDHLEVYVEAIEAYPDAVLYFADYRRFHENTQSAEPNSAEKKGFFDPAGPYVSRVLETRTGLQLFVMNPFELLKFCCIHHCPIHTITAMLRRETFVRGDWSFREDWLINEDFHVWMTMLDSGSAIGIRQSVAYYRFSPGSLTSDAVRYMQGMAQSHGEWLQRIKPRLTETELRAYGDKVAGLYESLAWEQSRRGNAISALRAYRRAASTRSERVDVSGFLRTLLRSAWWRVQRSLGRIAERNDGPG